MFAAEMEFSMKICFTPACAGEVPGQSCPLSQLMFNELCASQLFLLASLCHMQESCPSTKISLAKAT